MTDAPAHAASASTSAAPRRRQRPDDLAQVLGVRRSGAGHHPGGDRVPVAIHGVHAAAGLEDRRRHGLRRVRRTSSRWPRTQRFRESMGSPSSSRALAVVVPVFLGTFAALVFHREFPLRGLLRRLRDADDGDARGRVAGVEDDVPPAARRAELPPVARRHRPSSGCSAPTRSSPRWCWSRSGTGRRW